MHNHMSSPVKYRQNQNQIYFILPFSELQPGPLTKFAFLQNSSKSNINPEAKRDNLKFNYTRN